MLNNINFVSDFYSLKQFPCKSKNYPLVCSNNFFDSYRHNVYRHTRLTMRIFSSRLWLSHGRPYIKCKKGGVFIYFKNSLPSKVLDIQLLQECINFELKITDKICSFISLYRSHSQSKDEFDSFADNLELNLGSIVYRNPHLIVVLGSFNPQTKGWYPWHYNWWYYVSIRPRTTDSWTNSYYRREVVLHRFSFSFSTKFGGGIRCPIFLT